ncbi:MAG: saccharopine dehydrogenase NADP-binding domain-containing protein [Clostridia bacterium]|jgi:predicted amino acid dehydrogenase|nr:saccharopine dehydrogenase NADP-binding domain-containing protein [Clostridia bacterium]
MDKFAFIIHPLDIEDYYRKFPAARHLPQFIIERAARVLPPFKVSDITGIKSAYNECVGEFIACPLTASQFLKLPVSFCYQKIIACVKLAQKNGAGIVGLGAFTSVVGDAGITIANQAGIAVTTGNSYTVHIALAGTKMAAELMGIDWSRANVLILGATGSIGSVCARLLAQENKYITLAARQQNKLDRLAAAIMYETGLAVKITNDVRQALRSADIIIAVSSSLEHQIYPEDLKPGAIVCDVSRPRDVSPRVSEERKDVLVIEGGVVKAPNGAEFNFDFGFPPGQSYACMAETMILTLEKRYENYSLGREMELHKVKEIAALGDKHGFKLAGLRSFERTVSPEEISLIKRRAAGLGFEPARARQKFQNLDKYGGKSI